MKSFKREKGSVDFSTKCLIKCLTSEGLATRTPSPCIFLNLSKFLPRFPSKIRENLKLFSKNDNVSINIIKKLEKNCLKFVIFSLFFENFSSSAGSPPTPARQPPYKSSHCESIFLAKKCLLGANASASFHFEYFLHSKGCPDQHPRLHSSPSFSLLILFKPFHLPMEHKMQI